MSKTLEIRVVDPDWIPGLCGNLKHKNPYIFYGECSNIDQALSDKKVDVDDITGLVNALIRYFGIHELEYIVADINECNKAFAPVKEMTIAEIEKELGYKIKIVEKVKGEIHD